MWKLPWHVLGAEAYSDQVFSNVEECFEKYKEAITSAKKQVENRRMKVDKYFIFRHQVVALPPAYFDQRNVGVGDVPGIEVETNRITSITFEA